MTIMTLINSMRNNKNYFRVSTSKSKKRSKRILPAQNTQVERNSMSFDKPKEKNESRKKKEKYLLQNTKVKTLTEENKNLYQDERAAPDTYNKDIKFRKSRFRSLKSEFRYEFMDTLYTVFCCCKPKTNEDTGCIDPYDSNYLKFKEDVVSFNNTLDISKLLILIKQLRKDVEKLKKLYINSQEQEIEANEDSRGVNEEDKENKEDDNSNEISMKQSVDVDPKGNSDLSILDYKEGKENKAAKLKRYNNAQRSLCNDEKPRNYIKNEIKIINNIVSKEIEQIEEKKNNRRERELSLDFKLSSEHENFFDEG